MPTCTHAVCGVALQMLQPRREEEAVDMENGCITEEEMCANVEYLVLGHFERKVGDTKGTHTMLWYVGAR